MGCIGKHTSGNETSNFTDIFTTMKCIAVLAGTVWEPHVKNHRMTFLKSTELVFNPQSCKYTACVSWSKQVPISEMSKLKS